MDLYDLGINLISFVLESGMQISFSCGFAGKQLRIKQVLVYFTIMFTVLPLSLCGFQAFAMCLSFAALYGINRLLLENSRTTSFAASIIGLYIPQISFGVFASLEALVCPFFAGKIRLTQAVVAISIFLALLLCGLCFRHILHDFQHADNSCIHVLILHCVFFCASELYLLRTAYSKCILMPPHITEIGKQLALLTLQLIGIPALFGAFKVYRRACEAEMVQNALYTMKQANNLQRKYTAQANARYERTRSFRHDVKNHLAVLGGLIQMGDLVKAQDYLSSLGLISNELSFSIHTGVPVIDILLCGKLGSAQSEGINTEVSLSLSQVCNRIDPVDLCVIFANALDNAITACREVAEKPYINISGEPQGDFYLFSFTNSCAPGPEPHFGTGLYNIRAVTNKYGGALSVQKRCDHFQLNILLNIP